MSKYYEAHIDFALDLEEIHQLEFPFDFIIVKNNSKSTIDYNIGIFTINDKLFKNIIDKLEITIQTLNEKSIKIIKIETENVIIDTMKNCLF